MKQSDLVLVVEDDFEIRETLVEILEESGYRVLGVRNGVEALAQLHTLPALPGLILLDLMMPLMDGIAFRRQQLADAAIAEVPTVLISAHGDLGESCASLKFTHHLQKPIDLDQLLAITAQHCARRA